jgi:chaperonin GroEL
MYKQILFGQDAREKIKKGVNLLADAVSSTLGPRGQNVIFEESSFPTITKDGVTVAGQVFLEDKFENMGNMTAREAAENTNREAGDGTTTTIVLLREIFNEGYKAITAGTNPVLLKRGMDEALKGILDNLDKQAKKITTDEQKEQVAIISANNDIEMGKMIASVIKEVGQDGVVTVSSSNNLKTEVEYIKGTKLESGYESHLFMNDQRTLSAVMNDPEIIITTERITMSSQISPLIQKCLVAGKRNMVLFADVIEGQALIFLIQNYLQGKFTCVPVKVPSYGGYQRDLIYDLAALTEATVLGQQDAKKIEDAELTDLGNAKTVIIGRESTIISGAEGEIKNRVKEIKALLSEEKDIFKKEKLRQRLGRLNGKIANIKVGGASDSEQLEIRYRVEDAVNATRSAIEEGIVEGGGTALLRAYLFIGGKETGTKEEQEGYRIITQSLKSPLRKIVENGGIAGDSVVAKVLEGKLGYNALTNKYEDLFKTGIIDPKKVVRNEIINAVATAGILLTSGCAIAIQPEKK